MLRRLHLRLTLLYLLAGLALIVLVAGGAYRLVGYYFDSTTDLALQHKMAGEFRVLGAPVPAALAAAEGAWSAEQARALPSLPVSSGEPGSTGGGEEDGEDHSSSANSGSDDRRTGEDAYDNGLASIFVLPLGADGQVLYDPNPYTPPFSADAQAARAALSAGSDLRTVRSSNGSRVRLLTYRLTRADGPAILQVGRSLDDQDRILSQLLIGLGALGGLCLLLLGAGSWWLAGRSLVPAQQAWERQQGFVANASHELRTPLTLIRAGAEVAQRGLPSGDADSRALLQDVLQECDHMSKLVDDLLLLSRLDAGRLELDRSAVELPDLLSGVQRQVGRVAQGRGVQLVLERTEGAAWGDATRLRQVLLIVLDNAMRHTPSGGSIRLASQAQGRYVRISVSDTGPGIPPEHLPRVFERFYRADDARGSGGGSGLGLAIARGLIEAQHGQIEIASAPGAGTSVTLVLPAAAG